MSITDVECEININDENMDFRARLDEYSLYELEHDRQISVISDFKKDISKEPEFCGIFSLSSYEILSIFRDSKLNSVNANVNRDVITEDQATIFKSTYVELYNSRPVDNYIHFIALKIISKIYV